jgi:excisionase family DNA binding protein
MSGKLLTVKEVAERLQVKAMTVYTWKREGKLTFIKLPQGIRIREEWLEGWLDKRTIKAQKKIA